MKIRNNLNSGITVTLADGISYVFSSGAEVPFNKSQMTERIKGLIDVGYLTVINTPVEKTTTKETKSEVKQKKEETNNG